MILNTTLKSIRVVLGEATTTNECDITASWGDYAGTQFVPGSADDVTNGTTPVTIVGAPGTSEQRLVQEITVYNADTVEHVVTLQLDNNSTIRVFRRASIAPGGTFAYSPTLAVASDDASYFSLVPGSPDTLILRAPVPDNFIAQSADDAGPTGYAYFYSGNNSGAGVSGDAGIGTGTTANGVSGQVFVYSGDSATDASGPLTVVSGVSNTTSGAVLVNSGSAPSTGGIGVTTGAASAGTSGALTVGSGDSAAGDSGPLLLKTGAAGGAAGISGAITIAAGAGAGTGVGGAITISSGVGAPSGNADIYSADTTQSGSVSLGSGLASSGSSGVAQLYTGNALGGSGGQVQLISGDSDTAVDGITITSGAFTGANGNGGAITVTAGAGAGSGDGGDINLTSGTAASYSGAIEVATGVSSGAGSGFVEIFTGDAFDYSGGISIFSGGSAGNGGTTGDVQLNSGDNTDGPSGVIGLQSGQANNATAGRINIFSGAVASGDGNGGDIYLFPGAGHGTGRQGLVIAFNWPTADPLVSGGLWVDPVTHIVKMSP